MKQVSSAILAILFLMCAHVFAQPDKAVKSTQKTIPVRASLDILVSRVDGYWNALLQKKKGQAAEYIAAADRDRFINSNLPSFSNPHLKSLELSADRKEAVVTMVVTRSMAPLGAAMEWPVTDRWRFEKGNWYRALSVKARLLLPGMEGDGKPAREDSEVLKNEIRKLLIIENNVLDFGTVRDSTPLNLSLKYTLGGKEPLGMIIDPPPGFGVQGGNEQVLNPGEHELRITVPTWQLDGAVNERIVMTARRLGAAVPFVIEVKGNVYVPVSIAPKTLRFQRDESEKEIRIRNNSKTDLELLSTYSETRQVLVQPLPATVLPSREIVLKVKLGPQSAALRTNISDVLAISFAKPVDGMNSLSLQVILNTVDKIQDTGNPSANKEVPLPADKSRNCQAPPAAE